MNWNQTTGDFARDLVRGIADNGHRSGKLRDVDLSFSPLGKTGGEETCRELAHVLAENQVLTHLDISRCELSADMCRILAEGLKKNRTLLGLHITPGNEARLDTRGFIVPVASAASAPGSLLDSGADGEAADTTAMRMV